MEKDKDINLCTVIIKSYKNKKVREWLIDNYINIPKEKININVIKLISDHPIKKFKETFLCLLGHKQLDLNVLIYISSLGYYPEAFYNALVIKCNQNSSTDSLIDFLYFNIKYVMEKDEFIDSIDYIKLISEEKKKIIFDFIKNIYC